MVDSDEELEGEETPGESSVIRTLRSKLKDKDGKHTEELAVRDREIALLRAGLGTLSDKQVKALAAAHEGEFTAEAIKATAEELGFSAVPKAETKPGQDDTARGTDVQSILQQLNAQTNDEEADVSEELAAIGRTNGASVGSTPANADPMQLLQKRMSDASSVEELTGILAEAGLLQQQ